MCLYIYIYILYSEKSLVGKFGGKFTVFEHLENKGLVN